MKLKDNVAVVTGAGAGIGRAIGLAFLREGARTLFVDVNQSALDALPADFRDLAAEGAAARADVTNADEVREAIGIAFQRWGRVDILVNNAGGGVGATGLDISERDWDATFALCLKSQLLCTQAVLDSMRARGFGRIINMASNAGKYRSNTGCSSIAYSAAKGGVLQFTRSTAHAVGRFGITVNAIAPGSVLSDSGVREFEELPERVRERVMRETALGYFADPGEIASIAVFLASKDASYITGATILANGGWSSS